MVRTVRGETTCAEALVPKVGAQSAAASASTTTCARIRTSISERQSHRQLNLARGAGFTCRQARPRDLTECRAADDVARRTEVGMVEQIEHVDPEPQADAPAGPRVLDQRQIRVVETRPDDGVAPQVAEVTGGHEHRWIEPSVHRADDPDRARDVGTHAVRHAVQTAVAGHDVYGIAALRLNDRGKLPAARQDAPRERQSVRRAEDKPVPGIEIRQAGTGWECRSRSGQKSRRN